MEVKRRYGDFVWLYSQLKKDYAAAPLPPLPSKQRKEYLDRFNPEFIEKRRVSLQRFINRVWEHPTLCKSTVLPRFLEWPDWVYAFSISHPAIQDEGLKGGTV